MEDKGPDQNISLILFVSLFKGRSYRIIKDSK